jgi:hypothetical protein
VSADLDRVRLAKLLGMTTSTFDGEALAAVRRANELVKAGRTTWVEIVVTPISAVEFLLADIARLEGEVADLRVELDRRPPPPPRIPVFAPPQSLSEAVTLANLWAHRLNEWERAFVRSLARQYRPLSPKQQRKLWDIVEKIAGMTLAGAGVL